MVTTGFGTNVGTFDRRRAYPTYADSNMVAAAHPAAVDAGLQIAHAGGNAFDIAVASALATAVVMPEMCGLGGDLFAVFSRPGAAPASIQASGRSARGTSYELVKSVGGTHMPYTGPHSIGVPGMVDAYFHLLETYGTKSFTEVAAPAIDLARNGYALQSLGARAIAEMAPLLKKDEAATAIFLAHGDVPAPGTRLVQTDLAQTLEILGEEGRNSFYRGTIAERMIAYLRQVGSNFELADFADYESDLTQPYTISYRGQTVYQTAIPSQGIILLEALKIVEHADVSDPLSAAAIHTLVEAKKLAFADRLANLHEGRHDLAQRLLDDAHTRRRFESIDPQRAQDEVPISRLETGDTTYLCAADREGNMVSLIQSVSAAFGSGIVAGDTGVVMNNRAGRGFSLDPTHPNAYAPGKRSMHTLNAYLIANDQGQPVLVGGTPGGDGQPQWNLQAIVALIDAEYDVQAAIDMPRWTSWPGTDPSTYDNPLELRMEARVPTGVREELTALGHRVVEQPAWGGGGAAQIIARDPTTGTLIGGSDPRVEGMALGR